MVFQKAASNTSHMVLNAYRYSLTVADRRTKVMLDISYRLKQSSFRAPLRNILLKFEVHRSRVSTTDGGTPW